MWVNYPCGLANKFRLGEGMMVPVDEAEDAEDESSSGNSGSSGISSVSPSLSDSLSSGMAFSFALANSRRRSVISDEGAVTRLDVHQLPDSGSERGPMKTICTVPID